MNKKLLIALSSIGVAAGFWACGSGSIEPMDDADGYVKAMLETGALDFNVTEAMDSCVADFACKGKMDNAEYQPVSSSAPPVVESSSDQAPKSSSSRFNPFSSIGPIGGESSSSSAIGPGPESSSGPSVKPGDLGTCAAAPSPAELNSKVTWTFTWVSGTPSTQKMGAKYAWTFEGGTPATAEGQRETATTYATSGDKVAKLTVTTGDGATTQDLTCSVHVNGAPITGCSCVGTNTSPDVAKGQSATWSVTGCTTTANLTGYVWTVATADASGESASAPVAAKGDVVTGVTVTAMNDDESQVTVKCEDATAIDSRIPDYILDGTTKSVTVPAGTVTVNANYAKTDIVWDGNISGMKCNFYCSTQSNDNVVAEVDGVAFTGKNYITNQISCEHLVENYQLKITSNMELTCGKQ